MKKILVVIVTYNSEKYIKWCTSSIIKNKDFQLRVVDSGSSNTEYLHDLENSIQVTYRENIGFAKANNLALDNLDEFSHVLFLNPDASIEASSLSKLLTRVKEMSSCGYDYFSVPLIAYDFDKRIKKDYYDSLGIMATWFGKWYDVRKSLTFDLNNLVDTGVYCGAFLVITTNALMKVKNSAGRLGFEEYLYMYKEDIEFSLRLKKNGFKGCLLKDIIAYHCRGWGSSRRAIPFWAKYYSARNDIYNAWKYNCKYLPYSILKFLYVNVMERK